MSGAGAPFAPPLHATAPVAADTRRVSKIRKSADTFEKRFIRLCEENAKFPEDLFEETMHRVPLCQYLGRMFNVYYKVLQ